MAQRRLTIMIVPHSHKRIREITISQRAVTVAAVALVAAVLLSLTYAVGFHIRSAQAEKLKRIERENTQLVDRIREMSGGVVSLKTQLNELSRKEEVLRVMANLPQPDEQARLMGIGGFAEDEEEMGGNTLSRAAQYGMEVHASIEQLLRQAEFQRRNFEYLEQAFNDSIEFRDHLPTIWPVPRTQVYISSSYGWRIDPYTGRRTMHRGIDLAGRPGTLIFATANGVVADVTVGRYIGLVIEMNHLYGYRTAYGHLSKAYVRKGQRITRGQVIGEMGRSGRTTGPHLHYSVIYNNRTVDPENYFVTSANGW